MSELASFSDSSPQSALQRFQLLRVHLEDGRSLAAIAREAKISYFRLQNWLVSRLPADLVTLAQQGAKAYGNSFVELPQLDEPSL